MLADQLDYIVGVDPHRDSHALAVVEVVSGAVVFETTVVADSEGYALALKLVEVHALGRRAFAVEGTGSYGAGLTRFLTGCGERVLEVGRLRRERGSGGKTDALDAVRVNGVGTRPRPRPSPKSPAPTRFLTQPRAHQLRNSGTTTGVLRTSPRPPRPLRRDRRRRPQDGRPSDCPPRPTSGGKSLATTGPNSGGHVRTR